MSGSPQLVYGDGWDDIKDCCGGGFFGKIKKDLLLNILA